MNAKLELTTDEAQELDLLVKRALRMCEVDLHHSRAFSYKDTVKTRMALLNQIQLKLEACVRQAAG